MTEMAAEQQGYLRGLREAQRVGVAQRRRLGR